MPHRFHGLALGAMVAVALACISDRASACGCVVSTNTASPVLQAGERIVFAVEDGVVTAHIEIQYEGAAEQFAWLVPVPGVPEVRVGTSELFNALEARLPTTYNLQTTSPACGSGSSAGGGGFGCGDDSDAISRGAGGDQDTQSSEPDVLVTRANAGPYEYAILRADDRAEMLGWLADNRYFVPATTGDAVDPYVRPGAHFLALKLRAGESTGSIRPIVIEYASDYPMIPLILTSVAATADMGIRVWVVGESRAIPRNYQHVVINDERIAWTNGANNYAEVVREAIDEAADHHAFVTEYAGPTNPMWGAFDVDRFPDREALSIQTDRGAFFTVLRALMNWDEVSPILEDHFPIPEALLAEGVSRQDYYARLDWYLAMKAPPADFDPEPIVADIWARVVTPVLEADALFRRNSKLTRLYTVLSPEEMTVDPVFGFNPDLPDVSNIHVAQAFRSCDGKGSITLEGGRTFDLDENGAIGRTGAPLVARVEVLREEGPPTVVTNNVVEGESSTQPGEGCNTGGSARGLGDLAMIIGLVWIASRRRSTSKRA